MKKLDVLIICFLLLVLPVLLAGRYSNRNEISARYGTSAGQVASVSMDSVSGALTTITYPHHEIHGGSHFYIEGHTTLAASATLFVKL